jgi:hypothetical protein
VLIDTGAWRPRGAWFLPRLGAARRQERRQARGREWAGFGWWAGSEEGGPVSKKTFFFSTFKFKFLLQSQIQIFGVENGIFKI